MSRPLTLQEMEYASRMDAERRAAEAEGARAEAEAEVEAARKRRLEHAMRAVALLQMSTRGAASR